MEGKAMAKQAMDFDEWNARKDAEAGIKKELAAIRRQVAAAMKGRRVLSGDLSYVLGQLQEVRRFLANEG